MGEQMTVFSDSADHSDGYRSVIIETLDGNGEYVNPVKITFAGHVTCIIVSDERQCAPARSGKGR
jgi:hypothetical protein